MKRQISLKWKIGRYLIVFAASILALVWLFQIVLLQPMYENYKTENVKRVSSQIVSALDSDNLNEVIYSVSEQNDMCVRIFNSESDVTVGNLGCALYRMDSESIVYQVGMAQSNNNSYMYKSSSYNTMNDGKFTNIIYTKIVSGEAGQSVVMVYAGVSPVNATTQTLSLQLLYISIIIVLAVVFLTLLINRRIAKPLTLINNAAKTLPQGKYETVKSSSQYEEASELDATLSEAATGIRKADKAKRDLIANVSHDLRTPLTMIGGYGEMMRDLPNEKTDANIQVIINESKRLTNLVNDLLDLSKMQENRIEIQPTVFNMTELIEAEMKKYEVYKIQEGFEFDINCEKDLLVKADERRMEQVIHNFLTNAINYSGSSRKIVVRAYGKDKSVHVSIQDFGEGIDSNDIGNIWDRYYKIDKQHVRVSNGSGIGLSIVKQILELHHAKYGVESEKGTGSTFWFELPRIAASESAEQKA